jgi:mRNA interferase MazF
MSEKIGKLQQWSSVKQITEENHKKVYFKERDIFWLKVGENIGFEQNGKGDKFQRPVLVLKRYNDDMFLGIPLSTIPREGSFFYQFSFIDGETSTALLVQNRLFSSKRFIKKIGKISKNDFEMLKQKLFRLVFDEDFCPSRLEGTIPKENCENIVSKNETNSNLERKK